MAKASALVPMIMTEIKDTRTEKLVLELESQGTDFATVFRN